LVQAEANPFTKDINGRAVMDIALARGDEEITTLLRDFIGDLQRKQHPHLKTLEDELRKDALADSVDPKYTTDKRTARKSSLDGSETDGKAGWLRNSKLMRTKERAAVFCRKVNKNKAFQTSTFVALLLALFLPDFWVLVDMASNDVLDVFLIIILAGFFTEFMVQLIGQKNYVCRFFFWMDLVGLCSVPLDHSLVTNLLPSQFGNAMVMRIARMAKLGARAGRFTKLVKLLRFLPGFQQTDTMGTAKVISNTLNMALSTRVACLVILMVMVLPMFDLPIYPVSDFSTLAWVNFLDDTISVQGNSSQDFFEAVDDFKRFFKDRQYFPYEINVKLSNGTQNLMRLSRQVPARVRNRVKVVSTPGRVYATFNFTEPTQIDALCNCLLIITIMVMMIGSGLVLSNSVSAIVLAPLELLLSNVQKIASNIFSSVTSMVGKKRRKDDTKQAEGDDDDSTTGDAFGNETQLLHRVLHKLEVLSQINAKKSPLDAEAYEQLDERDVAVLQGFGQANIGQNHCSPTRLTRQQGMEFGFNYEGPLMEDIEQRLDEAGILAEDFETWEFTALDLDGIACHSVCLCAILYYHGHLEKDASCVRWSATCSKFLEAIENRYNDAKKVPYHNWTHAVDAAFTMFRVLEIIEADQWLSDLERFGLQVAAVCHDVGHPGLGNPFLIETGNELALQYNDSSPLESMHCATLFDVAQQQGNAMFSFLSASMYRELRYIIIEVILHTDYQCHFSMVKDLQTNYDMNRDMFDLAEAMFHDGCEFPVKEVLEFLKGPEVKQQLINLLLHYVDVSNTMKPFPVCERWATLITQEFLMQGDKERELGLPIQPLNDRQKSNKPYSQIAFIEFFVSPLAVATAKLLSPLEFASNLMLLNVESWFNKWVEDSVPLPDAEEQDKVKERIIKLGANV